MTGSQVIGDIGVPSMDHTCVASLLRAYQAYCEQLCNKETLASGIALFAQRFPDLAEANQFREITIDDDADTRAALDGAEAFFRARGLVCRSCTPAGGRASPALAADLEARGYKRRPHTAMRLVRWAPLDVHDDIRVLPARAMRAVYRAAVLAFASRSRAATPARPRDPAPPGDGIRRAIADAHDERLDDPRLDMFVATLRDKPAGTGGLFQVGDIGLCLGPALLPGADAPSVAAALMAHTLALTKRLMLRNVCTRVEHDDPIMQTILEPAGFVPAGTIDEFVRTESASSGLYARRP